LLSQDKVFTFFEVMLLLWYAQKSASHFKSLLRIQSISEGINGIPPSPPPTLAGTGHCDLRPPVIWVSKSVVYTFGKTLWIDWKALYLHATTQAQT
jgi:hypothetical protein